MSTTIEAYALMEAYFKAGQIPYLEGTWGVGKSQLVKQYCANNDLALIDVRSPTIDGLDIRGLVRIKDDVTQYAKPAFWPDVEKHGPRGVFFWDEISYSEPDVFPKLLQLGTDRRIGDAIVPEGWHIAMAGNRMIDGAGTMPPAFVDRMRFITVEPDVEAFCEFGVKTGRVHPNIIAFLRFRPKMLHVVCDKSEEEVKRYRLTSNAPSPRAWEEASKHVDAPDAIRFLLLKGCVGEAAAVEYEGYIKLQKELPSFEDVINDPDNAMIPTNPTALYAVTCGLAAKATLSNFESIAKYAARLPREFEVMAIVDATNRNEALCNTSVYVDFATNNPDCV